MRRLLAVLLLALTIVAPALAQERVEVRGETAGGNPRLVFDWAEPVSFSAEISDYVLTVRFARPFDAALDAATAALSPYIAAGAIRPDRRTAVFSLKRELTFRSSPAGKRAVIELIDPAAAKKPARTQTLATPAPKPEPAPPKQTAEKPAPAKPTAAGPKPGTRVELGQSSDGTRLEVDFGRPVKATASENGRNVVVEFEGGGPLSLGDLRDRDLKLIEGLDVASGKAGSQLSLTLADRAQLKPSRSGNRLIFDVVPAKPVVAAAPPPKPAEPAKPADKPEPLKAAKPEPKAPPAAATQAAPEVAEKKPEPEPAPAAPPSGTPAPPASAGAMAVAARVGEDGTVTLRFPWTEPVAAAAFRRGGQVWLVFDRPAQLELTQFKAVPTRLVSGVNQTPQSDATALRLFLPPSINPSLKRDGHAWIVELRAQPMRPESGIVLAPRRGASDQPELSLVVEQPGRSVTLRDPDVGDRVIVVPVSQPGLGVAGTREFAEFRVLDSAQGVAIEPVADRVAVDTAAHHVRVAAPGGLNLSVRDGARQVADDGTRLPADQRLLQFEKWARGGIAKLTENRRQLNLALADALPDGRNAVRLEMAQLYLANLMGNDALATIERIEAESPGDGTEARFKALKGAAQYLSRRYGDAAQSFADKRFDDNGEIKLWRAITALQLGDDSAARQLFRLSGYEVPADYPATLRLDIALRAAEIALQEGGPGFAGTLIDHVADLAVEPVQKGEVEYMRGKVAAAAGQKDEARKLWQQVVARRDPPSWVRAELALVQSGLADKSLTRDAAIDRLERLRYGWRGDQLERSILQLLARLQIEGGHDAAGLAAYRDLVTLYPESGESRAAADEMGKAFVRLFVDGAADALPPLKALGLYDSFRELTPAGPKGDELIRKLADRVAGIDLLGRAAELLDDLVRRRLQGPARAEAGARLAAIRLQNGEPGPALDALELSKVEPVDEAVRLQRDQLRARALGQQGKPAEALAAIAQDQSDDADRIRQDIHWRKADWSAAGKVAMRRAERLTAGGKPDARLSEDATAAIMSATVASALGNDKAALASLRQRYAQAMDQTPFKSPFRLIANGSGSPADLAQVARTLEAAQNFQKYLADVKPTAGEKTQPKPAEPAKLN